MECCETFAACLKRCLHEAGMTASEAARAVGFRSRNSIFRILQGATSGEVNRRFLAALRSALGDTWPEARYAALEEALVYDRLGPDSYRSKQAFRRILLDAKTIRTGVMVHTLSVDGQETVQTFADTMAEVVNAARAEIMITGCCDAELLRLLAELCSEAGDAGRLTVCHYIDTTEKEAVSNLLGIMPLVNKSWYNARLVDEASCPRQMMQVYRLHAMYISFWDAQGQAMGYQLTQMDDTSFSRRIWHNPAPGVQVLERWRYQLSQLKPIPRLDGTAEDFLHYTEAYGKLEEKCTILSIKPDAHFNGIPAATLYASILDGFAQSGLAEGEELEQLITKLWQVHDGRFNNFLRKRKPTHLVYSRSAMERFMRTGMLTDQFFLQRPYNEEERREIIRTLRDAMLEQPWFHIHFLKEDLELRKEISCYGDKGVMIMDASTGYALGEDHSEAFVTLPAFIEGFKQFFMESLLKEAVTSRSETLAELERLLNLDITS